MSTSLPGSSSGVACQGLHPGIGGQKPVQYINGPFASPSPPGPYRGHQRNRIEEMLEKISERLGILEPNKIETATEAMQQYDRTLEKSIIEKLMDYQREQESKAKRPVEADASDKINFLLNQVSGLNLRMDACERNIERLLSQLHEIARGPEKVFIDKGSTSAR